MKWMVHVFRILLGLTFIFSGFVKGVDPLGTAYKIEDYFIAYGMPWAMPLALSLSILLCAFEFSLGVFLLLSVRIRPVSLLTLLLMAYFTVLTFFDAIYNPVPDCGCFGDAIKLTNWETFYKNVVLILLAVFVYVYRKRLGRVWPPAAANTILAAVPVLFILFSLYNYRNLPMVDFTAWKTGNKMIPDSLKPAQYYLVYQNKQTGEIKEYLSNELPWQDSVWLASWEFRNQRIDDPNHYPAPNFKILDTLGNDLTINYLREPGYLFCLVSNDLNSLSPEAISKIEQLSEQLSADGYSVIGLSGSSGEDISRLFGHGDSHINWFQSDDTELKTMVRSNPGLVVMKDAVVMKKWHYRNIPDGEELKQLFPQSGVPSGE
ncbi:MAG TPA: DoxX family protein [Bacteroidales bacterium]|nr:DoxX family protein [Bacteroidales bacterium]HSA43795.1 DoxX family protein [Bacteroidales bacterium]